MSEKPIITFHATLTTTVPPDALYGVLSDPSTHLQWAGEEAPKKNFRLLTLESPAGSATVGTKFSSSGANSKNGSMTFYDQSVVVQAEPGRCFGFDTESKLERSRAETWYCRFEHRYMIEPEAGGSTIGYSCDVFPKNYRPWWLHPAMRPMTRSMVKHFHTKHMKNLSRMAESERHLT